MERMQDNGQYSRDVSSRDFSNMRSRRVFRRTKITTAQQVNQTRTV